MIMEISITWVKSIKKKALATPISDPADTYLVNRTVNKKAQIKMNSAGIENASNTPANVATPFPPLNFKKTGKI